jgi:hypothetical protein
VIGTTPAAAEASGEAAMEASLEVTATSAEDKAFRESRSSAKTIISLLEEILVRVAPPTSIISISTSTSIPDDPLHCREGYLNAFHQLKGVPLILRLLKNNAHQHDDVDDVDVEDDDDKKDGNSNSNSTSNSNSNSDSNSKGPEEEDTSTTSDNIVLLCLGIFRDICCLSAPQAGLALSPPRPSASEKLALDLVVHDESSGFLETLYEMASSSMKEIMVNDSREKGNPKNGEYENENIAKSEGKGGRGRSKRRSERDRKSNTKESSGSDAGSKANTDKNHPSQAAAANARAKAKAKAKQRKALETTCNAWSVYANLTYFESVTASMGKNEILDLADLAYWTVAALDCHITDQLVRFLPLATTSELESRLVKTHNDTNNTNTNNTNTNNNNNNNSGSGSDLATTSPEAAEETMNIATEVSRVLEPVLGTIRNLVADHVAASLDWEAKSLVSKLLDVLCKVEDSTKETPQPRTEEDANADTDANDWLHFVKQTFQSLPEDPPKEDASPETAVFRWIEESEGTVWELLGVFKVCLGKGILCTSVHDVERLVGVWIRCLRRFGVSSSRIVFRVLGLVDGLVLPSATMDDVFYGEEEKEESSSSLSLSSSSSSAGVRKQILLREGFLDALVDLSSRYPRDEDCDDRLVSEGEAVRTEIESMIRRLR